MHVRPTLVSACALLVLLGGCAQSTTAPVVSADTLARAAAFADGMASIAGAEAAAVGADPVMVARVQADAQAARVALAAIQPGVALVTAHPSVAAFEQAINDGLAIAQTLPLSPAAKQAVTVLQLSVPVFEAAFAVPAATPAQ